MFIKTGLFLIVRNQSEEAINNMLTNVTKKHIKRQLMGFTCFIIHVDSKCMGDCNHA